MPACSQLRHVQIRPCPEPIIKIYIKGKSRYKTRGYSGSWGSARACYCLVPEWVIRELALVEGCYSFLENGQTKPLLSWWHARLTS